MIRRALRSLWSAPAPAEAPGPLRRDWVLVGVCLLAVLVENLVRTDIVWRPAATVLAVGVALLLPWRRIRPFAVGCAALGAIVVVQVAGVVAGVDEPIGLSSSVYVLLVIYALYRWGAGREVVLVSGLVVVIILLGYGRDYRTVGDALLELVVLSLPAVAGLAVRFRAAARARELDQVRLGERELLARELHDTVAHHVSAMVVRAQAGRVVAATRPEAALEALAVIEAEGATTLAEMRVLVGALRTGEEPVLAPTLGVADLTRLARPAGAGCAVVVRTDGDLSDLHPSVGAAVYRIAQESVTNATRHATEPTTVEVTAAREGERVHLTVRDDGGPVTVDRSESGFGLVGMRERVSLLGGTFRAGPAPERGWVVDVTLPRTGVPA